MILACSKISDGNMSFLYGEELRVLKNKEKFFKRNNININQVIEVKQTHGNKVLLVNRPFRSIKEADGLITNKSNIILSVKLADCMAISFYDKRMHAIALIHAGFRGLDNHIIKKTIQKMKKYFQTNPADLKVNISPSIGPCHYKRDLWTEAVNQLTVLGVLVQNIDNPKICTYESKYYFSHRRSSDNSNPEGRFVTILGIKNAN